MRMSSFLINRICVHILLLVVFLPHVTRDGEKHTKKKERDNLWPD